MSKSVATASASELTFVEAFKQAASTGCLIRRKCWFSSSTLRANSYIDARPAFHRPTSGENRKHLDGFRLERFPEQSNWSGEFGPNLEDLRATDWEVV